MVEELPEERTLSGFGAWRRELLKESIRLVLLKWYGGFSPCSGLRVLLHLRCGISSV